MKFNKETKKQLIDLWQERKIALEGNILKIIDTEGDEEFQKYIDDALSKDKESRRKRLEITRQVQTQNIELINWKEENETIQEELKNSLEVKEKSMLDVQQAIIQAETAKEEAEMARFEAEKAKEEAEKAREEAVNAKTIAENDLDLIQKKTQFELMGTIIKVALWVILGVGVVTTAVFMIALFTGMDTAVIGSTWSNIVGILLTNSFSIVGTIMGVKYATEKSDSK
jgi:hypothetical protein